MVISELATASVDKKFARSKSPIPADHPVMLVVFDTLPAFPWLLLAFSYSTLNSLSGLI